MSSVLTALVLLFHKWCYLYFYWREGVLYQEGYTHTHTHTHTDACINTDGICSGISLVSWLIGSSGGQFSRDLFLVFCARGPCEQIWHGQGCPLFDVVHSALPLPAMMSPTSKVPWRRVWERMWRVTCLNNASFHLLTIARWGFCGPTRKLILFRTQSLVLCSK